MQSLSNLFKDIKGSAPARNERLCGAGSNREYYRLGEGIIGCIGTQVAENQAFIYLAEHLKSRGIRVPEVYGVTADGTRYLVEDLGDTSLHNIYTINRARAWELLKRAARELVKIQLEGDKGLD